MPHASCLTPLSASVVAQKLRGPAIGETKNRLRSTHAQERDHSTFRRSSAAPQNQLRSDAPARTSRRPPATQTMPLCAVLRMRLEGRFGDVGGFNDDVGVGTGRRDVTDAVGRAEVGHHLRLRTIGRTIQHCDLETALPS